MRISLLRYAGIYIATALGLALLTWVLASFAGVRLPTGLSTALPPMLAALLEGQAFARETREPLLNDEAWSAAFRMTLVVAVINAIILGGVLLFTPELTNPEVLTIVGVVFLVLLVVVLLVNRIFLGMGARSQLKALESRK